MLFTSLSRVEVQIVHTHTKMSGPSLAGVAQCIESWTANQGSRVQFPGKAHAWVVGQVPNRGHSRGNHTLMFLSLSFSLHSPL